MRLSPLAAALLVQAALWFWDLPLLPVWGDEQFTLNTVALPWGEIAGALQRDIHPPLYYYLLKLWLSVVPGDPLTAARGFSVVCALGATAALDRLWLRERTPRARAVFLALWTLSPCLLLYVRMARSYSLQLLLGIVALALAVRWLESKRPDAGFRFAAAEAALLYTHYLPGLAIGLAAFGLGLRRAPRQALLGAFVVSLTYLPWAAVLWQSLGKAAEREAYSLSGHGLAETTLRLGFLGVSFTVGEAAPGWLALTGAVLAPVAAGLALWAARSESKLWPALLAVTAGVAYLGAARWVAFPFVPARLLFLLPFWLWGAAWAAGSGRRAGYGPALILLLTSLAGHLYYRAGEAFLNKGYLIPYGVIAGQIAAASNPAETLVLADAFNSDPKPLLPALPPSYPIIEGIGADFTEQVAAALAESRPRTVWMLRAARDVSPNRELERAQELLTESGYQPTERHAFLPYSAWEREALARTTGEPAPTHHFQALRWDLHAPGSADGRPRLPNSVTDRYH